MSDAVEVFHERLDELRDAMRRFETVAGDVRTAFRPAPADGLQRALDRAVDKLERLEREERDGRTAVPTPEQWDFDDGFHTMAQLYEQRALWHALFVNGLDFGHATKSWNHHDGNPCFGYTAPGSRWFVVTTYLPDGHQVCQHYEERLWEAFRIPELTRAPLWDGHDAEEGNARMRALLGLAEQPGVRDA